MLTKKDIEVLHGFKSNSLPVVSVFLNTDGKLNSKKEVDTHLKELGRLARIRVEKDERKDYRRKALFEIEKVEDYLLKELREFNRRGIALFSCSGGGLWHEIELPRPPRNRFIIGETPYVRPLQFQEVEYHRYCTVLLDRNNACIYQIYQGIIMEYKQLAGDTPARVRRAGWAGYDESKTMHKMDRKISEHFRRVADVLFESFKRGQFEWLILGGKTEYLNEFTPALHSYLREKIAATLDLSPDTSEKSVLERTMKIEKTLLFKEQCRWVDELESIHQSGGLAVHGLEDTLRHLNAQAVDTLIVSRDFQSEGVHCHQCGYLGILEKTCPLCNLEMMDSVDVVTEAIDRTMDSGCSVKQVYEGVGLEKRGNIGALLRFRL